METILIIPDNSNAPIACDLSPATNAVDERLEEYRQLFARALIDVERQPGSVTFRFAAKPGVREWCIDLAAREASCCPFLGYHLAASPDTVTWTTTGDESVHAVQAFLDFFHAAPTG